MHILSRRFATLAVAVAAASPVSAQSARTARHGEDYGIAW